MLTVKGLAPDEEAYFSHVTLLGANGESLQKVGLNSSSSSSSSLSGHSSYAGEELVGVVDLVPRVPFCVRLSGRDGSGNKLERVSTEMIEPTHVQIQVGGGGSGKLLIRLHCKASSPETITEFNRSFLGFWILFFHQSTLWIYTYEQSRKRVCVFTFSQTLL